MGWDKPTALTARAIFGLNTQIKGNIGFVDDSTVMYPTGSVFVLHNLTKKTQRYVNIPRTPKVANIIAVSPNRKYAAVAEKAEVPTLSIYDTATLERLKLLRNPMKEHTATYFAAITFTCDSEYLVVIVGEPDWVLLYYDWGKAKVKSHTKVLNPGVTKGSVAEVCGNPTDRAVVCVVGPGLFRLLSFTDGMWRQYGYKRAEHLPLTTACWLTADRVLAGTYDGRIISIEYGELRGVFKAIELDEIFMMTKEETEARTSVVNLASNAVTEEEKRGMYEVRCLISFSKGFAYSCHSGTVIVFNRSHPNRYTKTNVFKTTAHGITGISAIDINLIWSIAVNPSQNAMAVTTRRAEVYFTKIFKQQDLVEEPELTLSVVGDGFHHGPIGGVSTCVWKPLFLTYGSIDRTVKLWNYEELEIQITKHYTDDISCISLHPSGLYCLIGLSDKLKFYMVLYDNLKLVRHVDLRSCPLAQFSSGGHLFAAVERMYINVFSSITFEHIYHFSGHLTEVVCLYWAPGDNILYSSAVDGTLFSWDMDKGEKSYTLCAQGNAYCDLETSEDGSVIYGAGSNGVLTEIREWTVSDEIEIDRYALYSVVMPKPNRMMFAAGEQGDVVSIVFPLKTPLEKLSYCGHSDPITKIALSPDSTKLISVSKDGMLCIWEVEAVVENPKVPKFPFIMEIMINVLDLEGKLNTIKELGKKMEELGDEHAFMLRQNNDAHEALVKDLHEGYLTSIEDLKNTIKVIENEHILETNAWEMKLNVILRKHDIETEDRDKKFSKKLIAEYKKYEMLERKLNGIKKQLTKEYNALMKSCQKKMGDITKAKDKVITEKIKTIEKLMHQMKDMAKQHEEIKDQIETDADKEIAGLKVKYEKRLDVRGKVNTSLKNENGVLTKKAILADGEIAHFKKGWTTLKGSYSDLQKAFKGAAKELDFYQEEILRRNQRINEMDKIVSQLTRRNQDISKQNFVLESKIEILMTQIKENKRKFVEVGTSQAMITNKMSNMEKIEFLRNLELQNLRERLRVSKKETGKYKKISTSAQNKLRDLRLDLYHAKAIPLDMKKLRECVMGLFQKYVRTKDLLEIQEDDAVNASFLGQIKRSENIFRSYKKCVFKLAQRVHPNKTLIQENRELLTEVNILRNSLKMEKKKAYRKSTSGQFKPHKILSKHRRERTRLIRLMQKKDERITKLVLELKNLVEAREDSPEPTVETLSKSSRSKIESETSSVLSSLPEMPDKPSI